MYRFYKFALMGAIIVGAAAGMLGSHFAAKAQEPAPQTFTITAGGQGPGNVEVLAFAPQSLQVHRGDTVTWLSTGFHNIRFGNEPLPMVIAPEVDGQPLPQFNPAMAFPTIESGAVYQSGEVNSGLPAPVPFSLVIDLEPGTYAFMCDVHPGMAGTLTVVANEVEIPSPIQASLQGASEMGATINAAIGAALELEAQSLLPSEGSAAQVTVGSGNTGRATVNQYFPATTVIKAGESVTWTIPEGSVEPHIVGWPPLRNQDVTPIEVEGQAPILAVGPSLAPMTPSGSAIANGQEFSSGLFMPGQSFTLTFTEPGVYPYTCHIHPGMSGTIVVEPAS